MVRGEVWKVFHGRRARQPRISSFVDVEQIGEPEDQSARNFERALETADEVRACLECLPDELRQLVMEAYTLTEGELSSPGIRERLAKNLGISRNAVDQRLSRAIRSIRERMRKNPGSCNESRSLRPMLSRCFPASFSDCFRCVMTDQG